MVKPIDHKLGIYGRNNSINSKDSSLKNNSIGKNSIGNKAGS
jgi:hypothetical protein